MEGITIYRPQARRWNNVLLQRFQPLKTEWRWLNQLWTVSALETTSCEKSEDGWLGWGEELKQWRSGADEEFNTG